MKLDLRLLLAALLIAYMAGLFTCKSCTKPCNDRTIEIKDTVFIPQKESSEVHDPVLVLEDGHILSNNEKPITIDSFISYERLPADTNLIVQPYIDKYNSLLGVYERLRNDYGVKRDYKDTVYFPASKASVIVSNSAKSNKIFGQHVFLTDTNSVVEKIITQRRVIGYLGLRGQFQPADTMFYLGAAFKLKFKNDFIIGASIGVNTKAQKIYGIETDIPIRFKKR